MATKHIISGSVIDDDNPLAVQLQAGGAGIDIGEVTVNNTTANPVPVLTATKTISQTPAVTAGAYSAGDAVGQVLTFANAARVAGGGGVIKGVTIIDDSGQGKIMEVWFFDTTITDVADNAAWSTLAEADMEKSIPGGTVSTLNGTWYQAGTAKKCDIECSIPYNCVATSLIAKLVTREILTLAAVDDISVRVGVLQD